MLGAGLFVAVGTGVAAMPLGGEFLQSALLDLHLPLLGKVHFVTSVFFDVGVYLIVVGLVLDILRSLGAEMDRQQRDDGRRRRPTADDGQGAGVTPNLTYVAGGRRALRRRGDLLLERSLIRVLMGVILLGNGANLLLLTGGPPGGAADRRHHRRRGR